MSAVHFHGERVTIGGRLYTIRALYLEEQRVTVESVDGFRTDVDLSAIDDEPPSFRRVGAAVDALRKLDRCHTCGAMLGLAGGYRCASCWEVETRLADYLRRGERDCRPSNLRKAP